MAVPFAGTAAPSGTPAALSPAVVATNGAVLALIPILLFFLLNDACHLQRVVQRGVPPAVTSVHQRARREEVRNHVDAALGSGHHQRSSAVIIYPSRARAEREQRAHAGRVALAGRLKQLPCRSRHTVSVAAAATTAAAPADAVTIAARRLGRFRH